MARETTFFEPQDIGHGMSLIHMISGEVAVVDSDDADRVSRHAWYTRTTPRRRPGNQTRYAYAIICGKKVYLHRFVMNAAPGTMVDHVNGHGWDCRKANLRFATPQLNGANLRKCDKQTSSIYKGVCWHRRHGVWLAHITVSGKLVNLGRFQNELDAARAYNAAAQKVFGDFARLNEVPQ